MEIRILAACLLVIIIFAHFYYTNTIQSTSKISTPLFNSTQIPTTTTIPSNINTNINELQPQEISRISPVTNTITNVNLSQRFILAEKPTAMLSKAKLEILFLTNPSILNNIVFVKFENITITNNSRAKDELISTFSGQTLPAYPHDAGFGVVLKMPNDPTAIQKFIDLCGANISTKMLLKFQQLPNGQIPQSGNAFEFSSKLDITEITVTFTNYGG